MERAKQQNLKNFLDYLLVRGGQNSVGKKVVPFVTLTRDVGCEVDEFVFRLVKRMTEVSKADWVSLDKEILRQASAELKLREDEVEDILERKEHYVMEDILNSFTDNYRNRSESRVKGILRDVIRDRAKEGHVVLVGRASEFITQDILGGLRVRIHAPLEWRVERMSKEWDVSLKDASDLIKKAEQRKEHFRGLFVSDEPDFHEYDLTFNQSKMKDDEMLDILESIYVSRWGKI